MKSPKNAKEGGTFLSAKGCPPPASAHAHVAEKVKTQCNIEFTYASHCVSREKSNKCHQCDYVSTKADISSILLKMHNGEKCNQCDFASS